jgi:hypothetical protein
VLFVSLVGTMFAVGSTTTGATADTVPCYNQYGQVPCPPPTSPQPSAPPTTAPPPTTQPPPPTTQPQVTFPPPTSPPAYFYPPPTPAPVIAAPATTAPTTTAPTTTAPPPTAPLTPPAILGSYKDHAPLTTTTADPSSPSTVAVAAVALPTGGKGRHFSARFIYAMVLDALLLMGIGGYVVIRRLHLV